MRRFLTAAALAAATLFFPLRGLTNDTALEDAELAWARGDFVEALTIYARLLDSPGAEGLLEPIALQTGELYHTLEVTPDGASPQLSPDGTLIAFERGGTLEKVTHVVRIQPPHEPVAQVRGWGISFAPDSRAFAYLKLDSPSPALRDAQAALEKAAQNERQKRQAALSRLLATEARLAVRDLTSGVDWIVETGTIGVVSVRMAAKGALLFVGAASEGASQVHIVRGGEGPTAMTTGPGEKVLGAVNAAGTAAIYTVRQRGGGRGGRGAQDPDDEAADAAAGAEPAAAAARGGEPDRGEQGRGARGGGPQRPATFGLIDLQAAKAVTVTGSAPAFSRDGENLAFVAREGTDHRLMAGRALEPASAGIARRGLERLDGPTFSLDGSQLAFQMMGREDWEIYVIARDGSGERRLTREIQHDLLPQYLASGRLLAMIGEARHRRSYLYDLETGDRQRLFHNNTVRTIAPEYAWMADPSGTKIVVSADRDGDTVSPERGVYVVDLTRKVTVPELRARVAAALEAERALRETAQRIYAPLAEQVKAVVAQASVDRVFRYQERLFSFDSKHITRPGNRAAAEYLFAAYTSFGYAPEYQTFKPRNALGGQTSNVLATLKGTVNPELVYVVSSHYDSTAAGPGADDDSSGTAALLETARIMAKHPQPATIVFASFTGEEAGLLGSREFVRQAVEKKMKLVGVLNNDMVGWANDQRLDNTIRYTNRGIRDVQHAAAMLFTNMITYDARYYRSTDAAAFHEAYGDIVGGIGSYPVLGNPHYHQSHDVLETINHQLVTEVAKTTAATLMRLAASPSRLTGLKAERGSNGTVRVSWMRSPESGVSGYIVAYGPSSNPEAQQLRVTTTGASLKDVPPGTHVSVKAVNANGLEGWDWARTVLR